MKNWKFDLFNFKNSDFMKFVTFFYMQIKVTLFYEKDF